VISSSLYLFSSVIFLHLVFQQTYYFTVEGMTSAGSVNVTSDSVTVVKALHVLINVSVYDGKPCNMKGKFYHDRKQLY